MSSRIKPGEITNYLLFPFIYCSRSLELRKNLLCYFQQDNEDGSLVNKCLYSILKVGRRRSLFVVEISSIAILQSFIYEVDILMHRSVKKYVGQANN